MLLADFHAVLELSYPRLLTYPIEVTTQSMQLALLIRQQQLMLKNLMQLALFYLCELA